ncbi:hypothetical protein ACP_2052 [Acidobacterium capsulatum ATCC 51196]|uniref:Uncharacterized protein n=1 Tax=Acidobacterium capsulatum (strain ATCC 51196 / DSM 11244 / BCRC 80197 / JCM 7670 / NBRC 15755 / NCIMB 13165 / 161) TaxID=240015 RepID=C1F8Z0_ACIC5|nr:hypothetical protein ACP_2052 [Acidobacterium capsulatum ATCC 51196]
MLTCSQDSPSSLLSFFKARSAPSRLLLVALCSLGLVLAGCSGGSSSSGSSSTSGTAPGGGSGSGGGSNNTPTPGAANSVQLGTATVFDGPNPEPAQIAADASGDDTLAWTDPSGQVYVSRLAAGSTSWTTPVALIPATSTLKAHGGITFAASDASGNTTVLFQASDASFQSYLVASTLLAGSSKWSQPATLSIPDASGSAATLMSNGDIAAAYGGSLTDSVQVATFAPQTQSWGAPVTAAQSPTLLGNFTITSTPQNALTVLWTANIVPNNDPSQQSASGVYAATASGSAGPFSTPVEIDVQPGGTAPGIVTSLPDAVTDTSGNTTAIWTASPQAGGATDLYASRLAAGSSTWSKPVQLDTSSSNNPYVGFPTPLVVDAQGNVTVAWIAGINSPRTVQAVRYDASTSQWSTPSLVQTLPSGTVAGIPALAIGPTQGEVSVFWNQPPSASSSGSNGDIYQSIWSSGSGSWGNPIQADLPLPTAGASAATFPVAAVNGSSSMAVAWGDPVTGSNSSYTLYANVLQ